VNRKAPKYVPRVKRIAGSTRVPSRSDLGEGHVDTSKTWTMMVELSGVIEDGMPGKNGQRKPGTTRGSPRRSRTAKASHISRHAAKLRCACEWGGWGRLSVDGSGQHNPNPSEGPWGGGLPILRGGASASQRPGSVRDYRFDNVMHEERMQTVRKTVYAGSRLERNIASGRHCLICQPSSRTGENPPYGMIGGTVETSASFEARSAPRSYPTAGGARQRASLTRSAAQTSSYTNKRL
jgi:hypothetical protein